MRPRRPRGDLVKRNRHAPGYSFPAASGVEIWVCHGEATSSSAPLDDPRLAKLLGVRTGTRVVRRFRVTGPVSEAPFQIAVSWVHPRVADLVAGSGAGEWLVGIEKAGHFPIAWMEIHRARMPTPDEASLLELPAGLPVLEIVRVGTSGSDGRPVEVTEHVVAGDRVETVQVLHRDESARQPW